MGIDATDEGRQWLTHSCLQLREWPSEGEYAPFRFALRLLSFAFSDVVGYDFMAEYGYNFSEK